MFIDLQFICEVNDCFQQEQHSIMSKSSNFWRVIDHFSCEQCCTHHIFISSRMLCKCMLLLPMVGISLFSSLWFSNNQKYNSCLKNILLFKHQLELLKYPLQNWTALPNTYWHVLTEYIMAYILVRSFLLVSQMSITKCKY